MSERKWTPGPWTVRQAYRSIISASPTGYDDAESIEAYGGHLVCESVKWDANAQLIAAAPDLYEALDYLVSCTQLADDADWSEGDDPLSAARAALAKARGEA